MISKELIPPEIRQNENGELSDRQRRFLLKWFFLHAINVLPMTIVSIASWQVHAPISLLLWIGTIAFAIAIGWMYIRDLWYVPPDFVTGHIAKFTRRTRGPTHYMIKVQDVEIRASKAIWLELEDQKRATIFYAPTTKWLLSFKQ